MKSLFSIRDVGGRGKKLIEAYLFHASPWLVDSKTDKGTAPHCGKGLAGKLMELFLLLFKIF